MPPFIIGKSLKISKFEYLLINKFIINSLEFDKRVYVFISLCSLVLESERAVRVGKFFFDRVFCFFDFRFKVVH